MLNKASLDLIKRWEGCKLKAYKCSAGVWTVGYGLTTNAGFIEVGADTVITQAEADWYLEKTVEKFLAEIKPAITAPINENELGAFTSLAYNIGPTAFRKSSALRNFNAGNKDRVPTSIRMWRKAGGKVVKGLVNRREAEVDLFLAPVIAEKPAPARTSPVQSKTMQASVVQGASAVGGAVAAFQALDGTAQIIAMTGCVVIALLAMFILKERLKAWAKGWR
jgi:lysozyme